jgi:plastocyanin
MDVKLAKVLKLINDLTKQELMILNQVVVSLIKTHTDVAFKKAAINFQVGDIVSFVDSSGVRVHGVITKRNPKTLQVTT